MYRLCSMMDDKMMYEKGMRCLSPSLSVVKQTETRQTFGVAESNSPLVKTKDTNQLTLKSGFNVKSPWSGPRKQVCRNITYPEAECNPDSVSSGTRVLLLLRMTLLICRYTCLCKKQFPSLHKTFALTRRQRRACETLQARQRF
jgi:hypothetical protein